VRELLDLPWMLLPDASARDLAPDADPADLLPLLLDLRLFLVPDERRRAVGDGSGAAWAAPGSRVFAQFEPSTSPSTSTRSFFTSSWTV
jgi:hypothetical protein